MRTANLQPGVVPGPQRGSGETLANPLDAEACYRALSARDSRFDGLFFTAVKTTGIYCRPVCAVKTPRRASCQFFATAAEAEGAGFRPCLRCRPELAPYAVQQGLAHAVWRRIASGASDSFGAMENGDDSGSLERLAAEVGLSSRQLRRVVVAEFGVTPVELAQTHRLLFAKKLLHETSMSMTDIAFAAGFGSVRRFNALFATRYGMAPSAIRRAGSVSRTLPGSQASDPSHTSQIEQAGITVRLAYRPPYAWPDLLAYFGGRTIPGVESVMAPGPGTIKPDNGGAYVRSVRIGGFSGWLHVTHLPSRSCIAVQIAPSLGPVMMPLLSRLRNQFDVDASPAIIDTHLASDPVLADAIARTPGLRLPGAFDAFELVVRAVLGQQVSVVGASTLAGRLVARFGTVALTPFESVTRHFPLASELALVEPAAISAIGLPAVRGQTLQSLAIFAAQGGLDMAPGTTLEQAVAKMKTVKGIGDWTAHYVAMRVLRYADAFPAGDLGLQKAAARLLGQDPGTRLTATQLAALAQSWSPWRGYAALRLWHSLH
ncbi:MAG: DNA-3-methyladenine glycosylase 2 family protein [Herminiimonas sp.]|nr:DNA-3-methyladenine glycosylase 2 family protein [Herminiimonas sp.]